MSMLLIIILGIWAIISIIAHMPFFPAAKFSFWYDLALIPQWNFFAPNPPKGDFILLFRDKLNTHELSNWVEVRNPARNPYFCWIWNPCKRMNKGQLDLVNELVSLSNALKKRNMSADEQTETIIQSVAYLALLSYLCGYRQNPLAIERQFAVLSSMESTYGVVFTSNFHKTA